MNQSPSTESVADRHRRLAAAFHATAGAVPDHARSAPTPCDGWTIADVIDHVATTQLDFLEQRSVDRPDAPEPTAVSAAMQAALDDPAVADTPYDGYFGPTTIAETVDAFYCLDLVLHRWDIAVAGGLAADTAISDADIERCRTLLEPMGDNVRMPGIFGPAVEVGADASATDAFVAWTGRQPAAS